MNKKDFLSIRAPFIHSCSQMRGEKLHRILIVRAACLCSHQSSIKSTDQCHDDKCGFDFVLCMADSSLYLLWIRDGIHSLITHNPVTQEEPSRHQSNMLLFF